MSLQEFVLCGSNRYCCRLVDNEVLTILRQRFEDCVMYERPDEEKCRPLYAQYEDAVTNWFIKCKALIVFFFKFHYIFLIFRWRFRWIW